MSDKTIKSEVYLVLARHKSGRVRVVRHALTSPFLRQGEFAVRVTIALPEAVFQRIPTPNVAVEIPVEHIRFPDIAVMSAPVQLPKPVAP